MSTAASSGTNKPSVRIREISPRLAFQAHQVSTEQKVELVDRLTAAGVQAIELSSFVHPKMVPGLADAEQVFARVKRPAGVSLECCVANVAGLRRAIDAGAHAAYFLLAADEAFSMANIGRSIDDSLAELARMQELAGTTDIKLGSYLIAALGGPSGLARGPQDVEPVMQKLLALGVKDWILADSCGYASPSLMRRMVEFAASLTPMGRLNVQVHDSRGMGLANLAALAPMGLRNMDTALAGSGAHPAAKGLLVGGTCTEDAVQMLELEGYATGVDLAALIETANWLNDVLGGHEMGFVRRSGKVPVSQQEVEAFHAARTGFKWDSKVAERAATEGTQT